LSRLRLLAPGLALLLGASSTTALAGARPYALVQSTETLPQGGLELENWFGASRPPGSPGAWEWWVGPVVGLSEHLETSVFAVMGQPSANPAALTLSQVRLHLSWLLADRGDWPVDVRLRLELSQPVSDDSYGIWLWVMVTREWAHFRVTANLASFTEIAKADGTPNQYIDFGLGASVPLPQGFSLGAECFGQKDLKEAETFASVGPSLAWARGRLWFAATVGLGLGSSSPNRGRLVVGVTL